MATKQSLINHVKQNGKNDLFYTPEIGIKPLLKYLDKQRFNTIWECTDSGVSNITKLLKKEGFNVISSDIVTGFDFLKNEPDFDFDCIITNPPFSLKDDFIKKCYEYKKPFALLLPITALEGVKRGSMYKDNGLEILVLDRRLCYMKNKKSCWFNSSWFCYQVLPEKLMFESIS